VRVGPADVGSNVTSTPPEPTAMHCVADGQAMSLTPAARMRSGVLFGIADVGSRVTS
jgi:hypothetical protein